MNSDFRNRVLLPIFLPLLAAAGIIGFAFALSRVLLAVSETGSNFIALFVAIYLLALAGLISARPRITSKALGIGLVVGLLSVGVAGVLAAQAGMRELHHEEEHAEGEKAAGEEDAAAALPEGALVWVAEDIEFTEAPETIPAGEAIIAIRNDGGSPHNVVIDELGVKVEAQGGESASDTYTLEEGTYTYYCDVPGHRSAGMEGQVTVQ